MAATLEELIERAQQLADMADADPDGFVSESTWTTWVNDGIKELHRFIIGAAKDNYFRTADFTLTAGQYEYTLPEGVRQLRGLDLNPTSSDRKTVRRFNFAERNQYRFTHPDRLDAACADRSYAVMGRKLRIEPQEKAPGTYRLFYVPEPTLLVADDDELDIELEPYAEYVALCAAIKALTKEESFEQANALKEQRNLIRADIEAALESDVGAPYSIIDVYDEE